MGITPLFDVIITDTAKDMKAAAVPS